MALLFWEAWPAASSAGAQPVERSALPKKRCSLVRTPTFESSLGCCPQTPALPRAKPAAPSAGARPGALRSRTREWLQLYTPPSGYLSRRWGLPPHTPDFRGARLVVQTARYRGKRGACLVGAAAHTPAFRCARLVLQAARYRGQRSAWQVEAAAPTPPFSAALGLSCRRLTTAGNEAFGRWGLPPPHPRFALCSACLAGGVAIPSLLQRCV
jgi:hypothetical protein